MIGQSPQERFSRDRRTLFDLGSLWLIWQQLGHQVGPGLINAVSLVALNQ